MIALGVSNADLFRMLPRCARCGCEVQEFTWSENASRLVYEFTARCHGDVETMTVSVLDFTLAGGVQAFRGGVAFGTPEDMAKPLAIE